MASIASAASSWARSAIQNSYDSLYRCGGLVISIRIHAFVDRANGERRTAESRAGG
jgi:hypothetical protein